jgi:hypothetical protein
MGYSGWEQHICENGHQFNSEPSGYFDDTPVCIICGGKSVFCNPVDNTNGESYGNIHADGWKSLMISPAVKKACNLGFEHIVEPAKYRVPTKEEAQALRKFSYYDPETFEVRHVPISEYEEFWEIKNCGHPFDPDTLGYDPYEK